MALRYKDPQSQQRWISEMKNSMPTMYIAIDAFYDSQKDIASPMVEDHPVLSSD